MTESWQDIVSPLLGSIKRINNKRKLSESTDITEESKGSKKAIKELLSESSDDVEAAPSSSSTELHFSPSQIAKIVEDLRMKVRLNKRNRSKKFLGFTDFRDIELPPGTTTEMLKNDLRRYLKEATMLSTLTVQMAFELLHMFLEEGHSITLDPAYPKRPPNAFAIFMKKSGQNRFSSDISASWKNESHAVEKAAAEKEALQRMEKYLADLLAYREAHPELLKTHREYLDNAIAVAQKAIEKTKFKKTDMNKKSDSKKASRIGPRTAFDLFALSVASKYANLEPERRERKLRKKFDKLSDSEREIYENLAAAL